MYEDKEYFPKKFIEKGDKLFGVRTTTGYYGTKIPAWDFEIQYDGIDDVAVIILKAADSVVASVSLVQLPGCCGVVVITDLDSKKGKGYGEFLSKAALYYAANLGYTLAIATTIVRNKSSNQIAVTLGARQVARFSNHKTKNVVKVWVKHLPPKSKLLKKSY